MPRWLPYPLLRAVMLAFASLFGGGVLPVFAAPNYAMHVWRAEDGLPQNTVTAVLQTKDGYLWVGGYSGLARFDGVHFTLFDNSNTPEMRSSRVTALFEAEDGTLWIGHEGGEITSFKAGRFQSVAVHEKWDTRKIYGMQVDETGDLWLVNEQGLLSRLKDGLMLSPRVGNTRGMILSMARNPRGSFWLARKG